MRLASECNGKRLRAEAGTVRNVQKNICGVAAMTVEAATEFFPQGKATTSLTDEIADKILLEIASAWLTFRAGSYL